MKIPERLRPLVEQGIVQEVVRPLMSGKEASLYVVYAGDERCVAKVYKDAEHRSFRHRAGYTEGRRVRNSRQRRAMEKGTRFGKEQMEEAWQNAEVDALYRLSAAGLRVPRPHLFTDGVLLMDLVVDANGDPAPRLWDVEFTEEQALELHAWLVRQCVHMLCAGMVHGDLSEYNVLLAWDGPTIIDLPQATDAAHNPNAKKLFVRDVQNLTAFLARFAPAIAETRYGEEIWDLYERSRLFADTPLTGKWKGSDRKADTRAVLEEIDAAAREARRKRGEAPDDRPAKGGRGRAQEGAGPSGAGRHRVDGGAGPDRAQPRPAGGRPPREAATAARTGGERRPQGGRPESRPQGGRPDARPSAENRRRDPDPIDLDDLDALLLVEPER